MTCMALAPRLPSQQMQAVIYYTEACWLWHSKAMLTAHCMNLVWLLSLLFVAYYANAVKAASTWEPCSSHSHCAQGGL